MQQRGFVGGGVPISHSGPRTGGATRRERDRTSLKRPPVRNRERKEGMRQIVGNYLAGGGEEGGGSREGEWCH